MPVIELTALAIIKLINTGTLLWQAGGPILQRLIEEGQGATATMVEVEEAQARAGGSLADFKAAVAAMPG